MLHTVKTKIGSEDLIIQTGKLAKQADAAVTVQYGGTVVLVTAVVSKEPREGVDFLPLTVEYQEKAYAAGKIPGGFFKREGRPSEKGILSARLIDRPIRPLFPDGFINDIQVIATVLSHDGKNDPDVLAIVGASAALSISHIPFDGPIASLRVIKSGSDFIANPTYEEIEKSDLEIVASVGKEGIIMIESGAKEVDDKSVLDALDFAFKQAQAIIKLQKDLADKCARPKMEFPLYEVNKNLRQEVEKAVSSKVKQICSIADKDKRESQMNSLRKQLCEQMITEDSEYTKLDIKIALDDMEKSFVRSNIIEKGLRVDGRKLDQVRPISCEVAVLPRTHGSGLFTRGQTQSLSVATLGTGDDEQTIDALAGEYSKSFMLHYNFPPFSVGEARPMRGTGRREIGHGALAEKSLRAVMPSKEEFPYTVRVVSEILESNGSSSMATVCAATLALMDAGVPIKAPVSGAAMGLVKDGDKFAILTDILGAEDHFGDMDFKVAGTKNGITAVQMDLKIRGLKIDTIKDILAHANKARAFILEKMIEVMPSARKELSEFAPRIISFKIDTSKIGAVIGPGGKVIKKIIEETGVSIDISDDGTVNVASTDSDASQRAIDIIKGLTAEPEVGTVYKGKVTRLMAFGAFVEFLPGKEGLVHVSELDNKFVKRPEDVVKVGDEVTVKIIEVDAQNRVNLSRKQAMLDEKK
ncbi:MAG: polyribonucleotide nucleotidyltransferase [Candidatus Omnitrophica bacterium CG12_big_fil_rev_8_21_14_0_65_43_15]|uniref:Polyribonucleotide nucleotidyltransferase n=1 Tax=Candidatus Taenaricola geysiri TaxID=1974752 RepID=A0A2J0LRW6_9BACT|nr:MAG: polyribonucleotide nucleotidyltransferase [Candidatus Omnitrophica bacterium CG12_big_fil_rev_8_21_14_0_65_43_15]